MTGWLAIISRHDDGEQDVESDSRHDAGQHHQGREGHAHQGRVEREILGDSCADTFELLIFGRFIQSLHIVIVANGSGQQIEGFVDFGRMDDERRPAIVHEAVGADLRHLK